MNNIYMLRKNDDKLSLNYNIAFKNEKLAIDYVINKLGGTRVYEDNEIEDLEFWKTTIYKIKGSEYQIISVNFINK